MTTGALAQNAPLQSHGVPLAIDSGPLSLPEAGRVQG
jgi:hypothetical protein